MTELAPAGERGTLVVAPRAIEKIAHAAALEVSGSVSHQAGMGPLGTKLPSVDADIAGSRAQLAVSIAVQWPSNLSDVAKKVRTTVRDRVSSLGGVTVDQANITVAQMVTATADPVRRVS